ncbi:SNF2 domain-containing protein CLASSY 1-like [Salvia hispanica]|uniref:SNF2 domain-containing protein CLASSY 1-like n=1 Tax=Salvia hispanica TaxID=49212 RepID=UPI0020090800|nr:SNF2 domain-containing protein CLASSY 1-like [Salvia hispanica]
MKRVQIHQSNHPFDPYPFEAFWNGSWQPVERLKINGGAISSQIVEKGVVIDEDLPMSHLRIRSKRATVSDCISFLRQGVDVCVFSTFHNPEDSDDETRDEPVWVDAKIRSIERKHDGASCNCEFNISFYLDQGPDLYLLNKKLCKATTMLKIDQISLLQKLELKPLEGNYYRWGSSENCFSVQKSKLFSGMFCTDLSWLIVASILKQTAFDVRSINNHIVYEVTEYNPDRGQTDSPNHSYCLSFKVENEVLTPLVMQVDPTTKEEGSEGRELGILCPYDPTELRRSKRRNAQPDRYLGCDNLPDYEVEVTRLGESKTYMKEYDESSSEEEEEEYDEYRRALSVQDDNEFQQHRSGEKGSSSSKRKSKDGAGNDVDSDAPKRKSSKKSGMSKFERALAALKAARLEDRSIVPTDGSADNGLDKNFMNFKAPEENQKDIGEMVSKYFYMNGFQSTQKRKTLDFMDVESGGRKGLKATRRKYQRVSSHTNSLKRDCFYVRESIYDVRSFRKGSVTAQLCRELIRRCMNNIDATLKNEPVQPPVVEQWKEHQSKISSNEKEPDEKPSGNNDEGVNNEEGISEIDMLWNEMEVALASWYLLDNNEESHVKPSDEMQNSSWIGANNKCAHDYRLDEEVGMVCHLCGSVETEIKDILPPFTPTAHCTPMKEPRTGDDVDAEYKKSENKDLEQLCIPAPSTAPTIGDGENNVWALIPELKDKLRSHQTRAFEFLWRNIAGSLIPTRMEKKKNRRGGCVISHTPGAGKTLLIIAFLVSYLKLFPGSRPLVLAPKTTLYTWYKEIIKWKVPIPVYQIHGGQTYKGEVLKQRMKLAPGLPRNQDVMHVLDCLEKMQQWLSHPSILLMGYTSFLTLTREDSPYAHRKYMAQLLKQCPGIMILDEGHNPRSTKSRLRKALMKVNTRLRVLLSGTLFQNNFGEYFNTLLLARPSFVNEVLKELDPKYEKRNKERLTQFSLENRGRKLLIDKISKKIDSNKDGEREQALKTLRKLTTKFIDVYEGGSSDELPGLQCYTLMMKSTTLQQEVLLKLQNQRPVYKGFPLELELLITLGAIHPWLIRTTACSGQYFSQEELEDLEKFKFDMRSGSKVRFVMNLVPRCLLRKEKLLIFCHNIAPINLFLQIFERFYGWRKGREVLVLQGDIELFERGRVMDKFEEPGGPSKVMLASITACAEGISLTAASRVILLDSEWNPSKSKQAIARAFRPGQNKVVYVYQLLASGTLEEEKHSRTTWKEWVSDMIFSDEHVEDPSHWQAPKIEDELLREIVEEDRATLFHRIMKNEKASNVIRGKGMLKKM